MNWQSIGLSDNTNAFGGLLKHKKDYMGTTQLTKLQRLLTRKQGATSFQIMMEVGTVSPHARLAELKQRGWTITKRKIEGKNYHTYHGRMM